MKSELEADKKKYENDLLTLQQQINELDAIRADKVKVGTRIEGALAYIKLKLSKISAEEGS